MVIEGPRVDFEIGLKRLFVYASPYIFFMVSCALNLHCPLMLWSVEFVCIFNNMDFKKYIYYVQKVKL